MPCFEILPKALRLENWRMLPFQPNWKKPDNGSFSKGKSGYTQQILCSRTYVKRLRQNPAR